MINSHDDIIAGAVCVDCLMVIANADASGIADYAEWSRMVARADATDGGKYDVVPACDDDCEGYFSWSSCDYCGSSLGGERHPIAFIPRHH